MKEDLHHLSLAGQVPSRTSKSKNSHLWMNRREYFKNGEYILVDKGKSDIELFAVY